MDVVKALRDYMDKMVKLTGADMKVLLLDSDTAKYVSLVYWQTEILQKDVFLVDKIEQVNREPMRHMKCMVLVRPTLENIQALNEELRNPKYQQYYIFFTNIVSKNYIERLAHADQQQLVVEVQEHFLDYYAVNPDFFHFGITEVVGETFSMWNSMKLNRTVEGLVALLLSLKKRPVVRYEKNSELAKELGKRLSSVMETEGPLFNFRSPEVPTLLLILDRKNDPVTPLLNQWTYQAMIHELIGLNNNVVNAKKFTAPDLADETDPDKKQNKGSSEFVLSIDRDQFYKNNMHLDFGELGGNIKKYAESFQIKHKATTSKIDSLEDMKRFMENYPEFKRLEGNVSKHVKLITELSRVVREEDLMEVSRVEQDLAAAIENNSEAILSIHQILDNPKVSHTNKLRVVLLYALRYEKTLASEVLPAMLEKLLRLGISKENVNLVQYILKYAGGLQRQSDLFQTEGLLNKSKNLIKLQGVENVFTQHKPLLYYTLDQLFKGKLKEPLFPFIDLSFNQRPREVILFVVGGVTYEEAKVVAELNATMQGTRIILGGTNIHNSQSFLQELQRNAERVRK